ncbi:MAG TPA: c-type cytochrome [Xanthobacteraceae bacterium]|nr:c-type cytochrome [Xanthobacteraceae bacterium]
MRHLVIAAVVLVASTGATFAQDVDAGATVFRQCGACHKIGPGATNFVGPELNGLDGRKAGSTNYSYSDAMKNSGITWNEQTFKEYIAAPKTKVPGTKMTYPGITGEDADKKIANLWAYIKQFKADGSK